MHSLANMKYCLATILAVWLSITSLVIAAEDCPCGWEARETGDVFTHKLFYDFSTWLDTADLLKDRPAHDFSRHWMIYDYQQNSDNPAVRLNAKYDYRNAYVEDGDLHLLQRGYSAQDRQD